MFDFTEADKQCSPPEMFNMTLGYNPEPVKRLEPKIWQRIVARFRSYYRHWAYKFGWIKF